MDTNAIYIAGNGKILGVYEKGDITRVFGLPYSAPSVFECKLSLPESMQREIVQRQRKAAIWNIALVEENAVKYAGTFSEE